MSANTNLQVRGAAVISDGGFGRWDIRSTLLLLIIVITENNNLIFIITVVITTSIFLIIWK